MTIRDLNPASDECRRLRRLASSPLPRFRPAQLAFGLPLPPRCDIVRPGAFSLTCGGAFEDTSWLKPNWKVGVRRPNRGQAPTLADRHDTAVTLTSQQTLCPARGFAVPGGSASRDLASPGDNRMTDVNGQTARILVVEDDHVMRHMIADYLEDHNMSTLTASGREELVRNFSGIEPDLVILDLRLEREDGLDLLREMRTRSDVPVIIITGDRRDEVDRVVGLELGADDYITKPFNLRELLARIRAVLRRQEVGRAAFQRDPERGRCRFGDWQLDRRVRRLIDPSGSQVALTKGEYALLTALLDAPQRPLSREQLLQATRVHEDIFDRSIDVQILRLRRKLEPDPSAPQIIQTERGIGYVFALPVETV
jgi:two-component system, OmpR family, response regulator